MKKIIVLFITLISYSSYSQFGGRSMQDRQNQQIGPTAQQSAPEPKFEVEKYLGILVYEIEKAAKKSSIKLSSEVGKKFSETLTVYNKKVKDMRRINSFTLRSTREMVESFQKSSAETGDYSGRTELQTKMMENLKPIAETLKEKDKELDATMRKILSKKQYNKWIKYNRKKLKVFPKVEEEEEVE